MARDVLTQKIREALIVGIETEQAIVYLLVETRKLADCDDYEDPCFGCSAIGSFTLISQTKVKEAHFF
jgi:hypothetical protein